MTDQINPFPDSQNVAISPLAPLTWEDKLAASHPEVVTELHRLALWVETCLGAELAAVGGGAVDTPGKG